VRDDRERIHDIQVAVDRAISYRAHLADEEPLGRMAYDAILRNLAVIGEAVARLPESVTAVIDQPWASIRGLRNIVVHEYFAVDPETITDIVDHYLAPLSAALDDYVA